MRRWSNILVGALLVAGACILLYPTASNWIATRNHSRAIVEYTVSVEQLADQEIQRQFAEAEAYNRALTGIVQGDAFAEGAAAGETAEYRSVLNLDGMIGYIGIPAIEVYLPVYHTVSEEVLRKGVGHMPATAFPIGEVGGHAVLSAHRGLPSAKLFTDLNRLEEGDVFYLHVLDRTLCYQVDQVLVVEPFETGALQPHPGEEYTTLVTCTPYAINSHRLLVRGRRIIDHPPEESVSEQLEQALAKGVWLAAALTGTVLLAAALAAGFTVRRRRAKRRR